MKFNKETIATLGDHVTGSVLLASGTITTPVEYFDLTLPLGFVSYELRLFGIDMSAVDNVAGAFSTDGGVSFFNDPTNFDTYAYAGFGEDGGKNSGTGDFSKWGEVFPDAVVSFDLSLGLTTTHYSVAANILPGSASRSLSVFIEALSRISSINSGMSINVVVIDLNLNATQSPTFARANLLRVQPYGNGDCNPPTSGETIIAGSNFLWGIPTP